MDADQRRRIELLIERLRRETDRLKQQVEESRKLHERSRERFIASDAILRRRHKPPSGDDRGGEGGDGASSI